ncbi:peptide/nickel transport system ATP-binding protein [Stella humosa]|uniref:Peptide/nickel transport system ATP-binding protein n=1 Tax=Stella humosa TaxID=94 RepID=A0A3N1KRF9_9PROT|nr:ABC transporter ATP-binding protein [Stella humosa]ROP81379.1 peptide/nickel transport system ATP-binding protein [Stella humosa]BBK32730.1 ABC transporter ATP-binding protein [Stella humosa]
MTALLEVEDLSVHFQTVRGTVRAVQDLSFKVERGQTVALVGESGSGKSTAALSLLRLLPAGSARIAAGRVLLDGRDLLALTDRQLRDVRGSQVGMIFQDPMMALNPVYTIGRQVAETLRLHQGLAGPAAEARVVELLRRVQVPAPEQRIHQYPHNLSGGMRQRVMMAMALACGPSLLIADEPTTALDVTVQAQVLTLIDRLKAELGMAVLLITHDLAVVWETAQRVIVLYAGRKVEEGPVAEILTRPRHPYTMGLLRAAQWQEDGDRLAEIPGTVPSPHAMPPGCAFAPRCAMAVDHCRTAPPPLRTLAPGHVAACFRAEEIAA